MLKNNSLIIQETLREVSEDYLNFNKFKEILENLYNQKLIIVQPKIPSVFSYSVLSSSTNIDNFVSPQFLENINQKIFFS
jgi:Lhr-like helicase